MPPRSSTAARSNRLAAVLRGAAQARAAALRGALLLGAAAGIGLGPAPAAFAQADLHHALVYYTGAIGPGPQVNSLVAERYSVGITGLEIAQNARSIKDQNPDFQWFVYNSGTDNYLQSEEDLLLAALAAQRGVDVEIAYIHFYDDTRLTLQGQTVFIPGWGGGSAATMAEARVPVYFSNLSRRVANFSTPVARQIHKEAFLALSVDRTFAGTTLHPDGIFLDNSAHQLYNTGQILEGGRVLEVPGMPLIGSSAFQTWHWETGFGPFLTALKDTLETSASWSADGKRKFLMNNVANVWSDSYVSRDVADILFMEFQYDPVRNPDSDTVQRAWDRDRLAAAAGIRSFYAPAMKRTAPPYPGEITYGEALLGSLAWHLTTRTEQSLLFLFGTSNPAAAGWDTLTWRGCVDVVEDQLGAVAGDPYIFTQGTDPTGKNYKVWARPYDNGLVLLRNRGRWDEGIEPETAVSVTLPASLHPLAPSGDIGPPTTTLSMRNGTGAILLGAR